MISSWILVCNKVFLVEQIATIEPFLQIMVNVNQASGIQKRNIISWGGEENWAGVRGISKGG